MIDLRAIFAPAHAVWLRTMAGLMLLVFAHGAVANSSVAMLADNQRLMLPGYIDYLPDDPAIQRDKLLAGEYDSSFLRYDEPAVNFQSGAVWLRIRIANQTSRQRLILSLNAMLYTEAELLYNRASDGSPVDAVNLKAGLLQENVKERWPYYDVGFVLDIPRDQTRTIYLRLYTPYIMLLNPYISDEQTYNLHQMDLVAWGHLMTGIMMGVLMYLIMITLFVRGIPEVWYCTSFVAVSFLILIYSRGYLFLYIPDHKWVKLHLYALLFMAQAFTYIGFSRQHFRTKEDFPHMDRLLQTIKNLTGIFLVASLVIPVTWAVNGVAVTAFGASILLCVCSVYVWANSDRHLTIYIAGTTIFLFVCLLVTAEGLGYINLGSIGRNAYQAGICLQATLFAVALAERISVYQREQSALAVSAAEAHAESRAKSSFLAKMSHELRTPMNGLLGMLQLLEKTPLNQQQSHYMHVMRNSGRILLGVIDDVLDYSRIAAGQLRLHNSDFNIFEEMAEIEVMFTDAAQQKNLQLRFSINPNTPAIVNSDVARLRQILTNLIGNAIKFTERGSVTVRLWVEQSSDEVWLLHGEVEDTGIGIADDQIKNLFREYSQVDGGKNYGGSGLGLVICKQLIEMMHGAIHVESALGYGSVFRFHISVQPPLQQTAADDMPDRFHSTPVRGTPHVLVVEDNDINSEVIVGMLNQLGYYAASVANGQDAVNAICSESNHWNLVLMDVEMPVLDGLAATQKIRTWEIEHYRNAIPIIALTAHTASTHGDEILKAGMDDYLSKPVDIALLKSLLIRWLPTGAVAE